MIIDQNTESYKSWRQKQFKDKPGILFLHAIKVLATQVSEFFPDEKVGAYDNQPPYTILKYKHIDQ